MNRYTHTDASYSDMKKKEGPNSFVTIIIILIALLGLYKMVFHNESSYKKETVWVLKP